MSGMYERQTQYTIERDMDSKRVVPTSKKSIKSSNLIEPPIEEKPCENEGQNTAYNAYSEPNINLSFDYKNITESEVFDNFLTFAMKKYF